MMFTWWYLLHAGGTTGTSWYLLYLLLPTPPPSWWPPAAAAGGGGTTGTIQFLVVVVLQQRAVPVPGTYVYTYLVFSRCKTSHLSSSLSRLLSSSLLSSPLITHQKISIKSSIIFISLFNLSSHQVNKIINHKPQLLVSPS